MLFYYGDWVYSPCWPAQWIRPYATLPGYKYFSPEKIKQNWDEPKIVAMYLDGYYNQNELTQYAFRETVNNVIQFIKKLIKIDANERSYLDPPFCSLRENQEWVIPYLEQMGKNDIYLAIDIVDFLKEGEAETLGQIIDCHYSKNYFPVFGRIEISTKLVTNLRSPQDFYNKNDRKLFMILLHEFIHLLLSRMNKWLNPLTQESYRVNEQGYEKCHYDYYNKYICYMILTTPNAKIVDKYLSGLKLVGNPDYQHTSSDEYPDDLMNPEYHNSYLSKYTLAMLADVGHYKVDLSYKEFNSDNEQYHNTYYDNLFFQHQNNFVEIKRNKTNSMDYKCKDLNIQKNRINLKTSTYYIKDSNQIASDDHIPNNIKLIKYILLNNRNSKLTFNIEKNISFIKIPIQIFEKRSIKIINDYNYENDNDQDLPIIQLYETSFSSERKMIPKHFFKGVIVNIPNESNILFGDLHVKNSIIKGKYKFHKIIIEGIKTFEKFLKNNPKNRLRDVTIIDQSNNLQEILYLKEGIRTGNCCNKIEEAKYQEDQDLFIPKKYLPEIITFELNTSPQSSTINLISSNKSEIHPTRIKLTGSPYQTINFVGKWQQDLRDKLLMNSDSSISFLGESIPKFGYYSDNQRLSSIMIAIIIVAFIIIINISIFLYLFFKKAKQ